MITWVWRDRSEIKLKKIHLLDLIRWTLNGIFSPIPLIEMMLWTMINYYIYPTVHHQANVFMNVTYIFNCSNL